MYKAESRLEAVLWSALLLVPLILGLSWGAYFDDSVYATFRHARNLAAGGGLADHLIAEEQPLLSAPLYELALALLTWLRIPLPQTVLVLSAWGWGIAAVAIYLTNRGGRRSAAALSAILVALNPVVVSTLGTEVSWTVAWTWIAVASSVRRRWRVQVAASALMLGTHLGLTTLTLAMLLLVVQWRERRRFPLALSLVLAVAALVWMSAVVVCHVPIAPAWPSVGDQWSSAAQRLAQESELYGLAIPLLLCGVAGLYSTARGTLWAATLWAGIAVLSGSAAAGAMMISAGLFLTGLGIDWIIGQVEAHSVVRLDRITLTVSLVLVAGGLLGVAQASSLQQRYRFRPLVRQALEAQVGDWLRAHSEPAATVFGSERVGYLADRATISWDGGESDQAELASHLQTLNKDLPEYCVSFKSIAWQRVIQADWFQDNYVPVQEFESPYEAASPFTVWKYRFSDVDWGVRQPLNLKLPEGVNWVGYSYSPDRIPPGGGVHVTFFMEATQPFTQPYNIVVEVISPLDGAAWARRTITPSEALMEWWQAGGAIAERIVMTTTPDISVGAYRLDAHVVKPRSGTRLPFYRGDDTSPLDRITLGYVVVPWHDDVALDRARPVEADFGDQIRLLGFEAQDHLSPGAEYDVTLYWEALRPPDDEYIIFVHLLNTEGQVVANHDGPPMGGQYTTRAWIPGEVVPDVHSLALGSDSPPGTYRLQVGMYNWPAMERLPVWDSQGVEQTDRVLILQSVEVQNAP
jgi:hypothetical protein